MVKLRRPTNALVNSYLEIFRSNDRYFLADQAITKLFTLLPANHELDDVLLKVTVLNDLYGTNIWSSFEMARHILGLKIDDSLRSKSCELVDRIANATFSGKSRHVFSFASKYCSWHDRESYPIYDSYVSKVLIAYQQIDRFAPSFPRSDLRFYRRYKEVVTDFRKYYELMDFSFDELDKFLWLYGKEMFPPSKKSKS